MARLRMSRFHAVSRQFPSAGLLGCGLAALIFLWLPLSLQSQEAASLRGTVRDAQGNPVPGAAVRLQVKDAAQTQTTHTDAQGNYLFSDLHGGVYVLRAAMAGYRDAEIPSLFLAATEAKSVDIILLPAKIPEPHSSSPPGKPEFFDQPKFAVAGVTDTTSLGGHGSDTIVRTREALAKETVSLGKDPASAASPGNYERERDQLKALLADEKNAQDDKPELHHRLGDVQEKLGNPLEAVREYQRAAELDPSETYLFDWGSELLLHHAPEPALEVFTQGNRLFPGSVRILIGLGAARFALGSYNQAVQQVCAASDLNPSDPVPYLFLGRMQSAQTTSSDDTRSSAGVVEKLHRFVTLQPQNAEANYYYAVGLWKLRKAPEDAASAVQIENFLKNAIRLEPMNGAAYLQLGILHSEQKDYPQAISDYQHALQTNAQAQMPMQVEEAHFRLAQAYRQVGDAVKAEAELREYSQIARESAKEEERERHEIRQFVYTLRDQPALQNTPEKPAQNP
jgi:tetratricopeptide (TPR) repeat protein